MVNLSMKDSYKPCHLKPRLYSIVDEGTDRRRPDDREVIPVKILSHG